MEQDVDASVALGVAGQGESAGEGGSVGAPGDGDEEGVEAAGHAVYAGEEVVEARFGFGGKVFEGVVVGYGRGIIVVVDVVIFVMVAIVCGFGEDGLGEAFGLDFFPSCDDFVDDSGHGWKCCK